jgi:hypothetical protein
VNGRIGYALRVAAVHKMPSSFMHISGEKKTKKSTIKL